MRTQFLMSMAVLMLAGCSDSENLVSLPDGPGAWLIIEESIFHQSGAVTVASRNAKGETTTVHGTYTSSQAGVAIRQIEVKAECGVMFFQQLAGHLEYKDPDRASRAAGAKNCGFADRLKYSGWKLKTLKDA